METMNREALQNFAREFADFTEDYAIIGGAACHLWFASRNTDFRITQDMDLVLLVRTESQPFLQKLLDFLKQHDYQAETIELDDGTRKARLYRFNNDRHPEFPAQIELLGPDDETLHHALGQRSIPVKAGGEYSGLSCMLMDSAYFQLLRDYHQQVDGISVADENVLVVYKMKAYLNIMATSAAGKAHGSDGNRKNAYKHRNDAVRLLLEGRIEQLPVPREIHDDVQNFANLLQGDASVRASLVSSFHSLYPQLNVTPETLDELASIIRDKFPLRE